MIRNIQYNSLEDFIKELSLKAYYFALAEEWDNIDDNYLNDFIEIVYSNPELNKHWEPLLTP